MRYLRMYLPNALNVSYTYDIMYTFLAELYRYMYLNKY